MSRPWFPFYVGDYVRDTARLSTEAHGAYLLLMLDYWVNGAPPDDDEVLATITKLPVTIWRKRRRSLSQFFDVSGGKWTHRRIEKELAKAEGVISARAQAGAEGANGKWGDRDFDNKVTRSQRLAAARAKASHTASEWKDLVAFCGAACVKCGSAEVLVKDHIIPIYQGGSDGIENLQPLCRSCNAAKGPEDKDYRQDGWQSSIKCLPERLANALQSQAQSQPQSPSNPDSKKGESNSRSKNLSLVGEDDRPQRIDETYEPSDRAIEYAYSLGMKKLDLTNELSKFIALSMTTRAVSFNIDMTFKVWCDRWLEHKRRHDPDWKPAPEPAAAAPQEPFVLVIHGTIEAAAWDHNQRAKGLRPLFYCKQIKDGVEVIAARCKTLVPDGYDEATGEKLETSVERVA